MKKEEPLYDRALLRQLVMVHRLAEYMSKRQAKESVADKDEQSIDTPQ